LMLRVLEWHHPFAGRASRPDHLQHTRSSPRDSARRSRHRPLSAGLPRSRASPSPGPRPGWDRRRRRSDRWRRTLRRR
jgi:hypothetical protein